MRRPMGLLLALSPLRRFLLRCGTRSSWRTTPSCWSGSLTASAKCSSLPSSWCKTAPSRTYAVSPTRRSISSCSASTSPRRSWRTCDAVVGLFHRLVSFVAVAFVLVFFFVFVVHLGCLAFGDGLEFQILGHGLERSVVISVTSSTCSLREVGSDSAVWSAKLLQGSKPTAKGRPFPSSPWPLA